MSRDVPPSSSSALDKCALDRVTLALDWKPGALSGTMEAEVPGDVEAFKLAEHLRELDTSAGYACAKRPDHWVIVSMPDDPPAPDPNADAAQISELLNLGPNYQRASSVYCTTVNLYCAQFPSMRCEFMLYGPSDKYLTTALRRLENAVRPHLGVRHTAAKTIDYGEDYNPADPANSYHPLWADDGSNFMCVVEAVGMLYGHLRRIYPRGLPTSDDLARRLAPTFKELPYE